MKAIKFISTFIILSFFPSLTFAQQLTEKEKKELQIRVMNKIEDFQQYISLIASRKVSSQNKDLAIEKALTRIWRQPPKRLTKRRKMFLGILLRSWQKRLREFTAKRSHTTTSTRKH